MGKVPYCRVLFFHIVAQVDDLCTERIVLEVAWKLVVLEEFTVHLQNVMHIALQHLVDVFVFVAIV